MIRRTAIPSIAFAALLASASITVMPRSASATGFTDTVTDGAAHDSIWFLVDGSLRLRGNVFYNLGCGGEGYSNLEVVQCAERITGKKIPTEIGPRRPGDPPTLVASSEKVRKDLGWKPKRKKLETMVESAWKWMEKRRV